MNKNKKRIIALAGVTGMILSLSCHLLDMPIRAKEASITLIKDPVYTDHDKVALFPKTQDTKEDVSVQNHVLQQIKMHLQKLFAGWMLQN